MMTNRFSLFLVLAANMVAVQANAQDRATTATDLTAAYVSPSPVQSASASSLYMTDFEAFTPGDVNTQDGWIGQFGNWTIETANPFGGAQHFRGLSDALGQSIAFTPFVAVGADDLSSTSAMISLDGTGSTWEYIPQSPTAGLVNTRIRFDPSTLEIIVLASDGIGGSAFENTGSFAPAGYFELGFEVSATDLSCSVFINGVSIYDFLCFAAEVEQVLILGAMEAAGQIFDMDDLTINDGAIPVELTSFNATTNGSAVNLAWETASETNNAGFEVQMQNGDSWTALGFVEGHGTTTEAQSYNFSADLGVGTHTFRLKQIDYDGAFEYHGNIEATIETPGTHALSAAYPNPFNPQSQFTLSVAQEQLVTAELYNTLGQRVATLFNGTVEANQIQNVTIDGAGLASGLYIVRVNGENFTDVLRVTLLK